jgi:hypothetical protein
MHRVVGSLLFVFPVLLPADVIVDSSLSMNQLQITSSTGTVAFSGVTASALGNVFDGSTNSCLATGAQTGDCFGYDPGWTTASISAAQGNVSTSANADSVVLTEDASSDVNIPGTDTAGTYPPGSYGDLSGSFEIVDSSNSGQNPVTVNFSALLSGNQDLFMDSNGVAGWSEVSFDFVVTGMFTGGFQQTSELFLDSQDPLSSTQSITSPIDQTLTASDDTLLTNTMYSFNAQVDADSFGANAAPEPSFFALTGIGLAGLLLFRYSAPTKLRSPPGDTAG